MRYLGVLRRVLPMMHGKDQIGTLDALDIEDQQARALERLSPLEARLIHDHAEREFFKKRGVCRECRRPLNTQHPRAMR